MNLRKFIFNSKILDPYIKNFERKDGENVNLDTSYAHEVLNSVKEGNFKILGIPWDKEEDQFMLNLYHLPAKIDSKKMTKREHCKRQGK